MFWSRKTFAPAKYDVVIMGDSRVYRGVSPKIIEENLPDWEVLNFGYSNGGLNPVMFDAAESKLDKKDKTNIIVMGITANTLTDYSRGNDQYFQELNRPREKVIERLYLNPILYWFSADLSKLLKNSFKQKPDSSYYTSDYHMNGYVESEKFPVDTLEAIPLYKKDFMEYKVEKASLYVLFNQVAEWQKEGITVFAFRPPVSFSMKALEYTMGLYDENYIRSGIEKAGGYWIDLDFSEYQTYDGSHLDKNSAKKLSEVIGNELNDCMNMQ